MVYKNGTLSFYPIRFDSYEVLPLRYDSMSKEESQSPLEFLFMLYRLFFFLLHQSTEVEIGAHKDLRNPPEFLIDSKFPPPNDIELVY